MGLLLVPGCTASKHRMLYCTYNSSGTCDVAIRGGHAVTIRTFQPGDEAAQVAIYNEAAGALPKFKPASVPDVARRIAAPGFDPSLCFYAQDGGQVVAYALAHANGRVSYPWCRPGHQVAADALFEHMIQELRRRKIGTAFTAYRGDWPTVLDYFLGRRFRRGA